MRPIIASDLPLLPLLLWEAPPGLELMLGQEGVPFGTVRDANPLAFERGRFVLYDGRRLPRPRVRAMLRPDHVAIDVNVLRRDEPTDPFAAVLDTRAALLSWSVSGISVEERVAAVDRAAVRQRVLGRLRRAICAAGGVWARLAPFPYPYRAAFNFRADLDETVLEDYYQFARARCRLADCVTHFVSTSAYGDQPGVLADLARFDTQSHAHHHVIYRDAAMNRRNIERAHEVLVREGIAPVGFAGPGGRWNKSVAEVLESLGYEYASDFQVGRDDRPFFPWVGDRFSKVLQVPIHPICEGLFQDLGITDSRPIADHLVSTVLAKIRAGEPAFVYGHPERRLGRYPEVLGLLADTIAHQPFLWRVTMTEFARWWRWRLERSWTVVPRGANTIEAQFDDWDAAYPLGLEVVRRSHVATLPVTGPRFPFALGGLVYERREPAALCAPSRPGRTTRRFSVKKVVREALDWETVTPIEELGPSDLRSFLKYRLRRWRDRRAAS